MPACTPTPYQYTQKENIISIVTYFYYLFVIKKTKPVYRVQTNNLIIRAIV